MIESLESRTLLSADWVGTWQVSGVDLTMRSMGSTGGVVVTSPALTVALTDAGDGNYTSVITSKVGKVISELTPTFHTDASGLFVDMETVDRGIGGAPDIYWTTSIRMMQVDASVKLFDSTSVGYTNIGGVQRIYEINMYAGVASQEKLQVVSFPYTGDYSFHGFRMMVDTAGGQVQINADDEPRSAVITQTGRAAYNIATQDIEGSTPNNPFRDRAGRLSQITAMPLDDSNSYIRYLQMYYRGPHGRLYFRSGGMETNADPARTDAAGSIPLGQILSGTSWAGYSDTAPQNFAPILAPAAAVPLNGISEDPSSNPGTSIHEILASPQTTITDWNSGDQKGIAITSFDSRKGTWEYTTNGGTTWLPVGRVSTAKALLLSDSDENRIRFIPKANYNGTLTRAIRFRAWDQTAGANGTFVSTARAGKLTAFSATRNYASLVVDPVNDAPVLSGTLAQPTFSTRALRIGSGLRIRDVDNKYLSGATIELAAPQAGDVLRYTGTLKGILLDPASTVTKITLSGRATLSAYLAAIRSITFTAATPVTSGDRTITIQVVDESGVPLVSNTLAQTIHVPATVSPLMTSVFSDVPLAGGAAGLLA